MATIKKRLSRKWILEVNTGTEAVPVWTQVKGLTKLGLTVDATEVDVTDMDSEGWEDNLTAVRKWTVDVEGFDGYTGTLAAPVNDPGQVALKAKGLLTGDEAYIDVQLYRSDTLTGYTGRANADWKGAGGDVKGAEPFNCALKGSGALSPLTVTP